MTQQGTDEPERSERELSAEPERLHELLERRDRSERAARTFVANAAHEFGTPLAGIIGSVEALESGAKHVPEDRDRFLAHIDRESARLRRLVRALLVLARLESTAEPPRLEVVPLAALLDELVSDVHPAPGVRVRASCPPGLAVIGNRDLIEQALLNLLGNAARFTRSGGIEVVARAARSSSRIEVADTGPGIPAEARERVFERFFRVSDDGEGFGLGLPIAREAIEAMDGTLVIDSTPGEGTRVVVHLPRARLLDR